MASTKETRPGRPISALGISLVAVLVGVIAGVGAVFFRWLIGFFHNLLFLGKLSIFYDANHYTPPSPWGAGIILVPVLGAILVAFLVQTFAPEAKGHGVPEVMDAIYYNKGLIRPVVALIKSLASALSIGSGGSVGREGPIIQIASAFGSSMGQLLRLPAWQRVTLIAAGAGGGIAATFNTPIGGILFAAEIMLHEISVRTLVPVAISTATATYFGRLLFGVNPSFVIPAFQVPYFHLTQPLVLLAYVGLGILMGGVSALFIKSLYGCEDLFEKHIRGNYYTRHALGMLVVGIMIYALLATEGHYFIEGIGYATIQEVLSDGAHSFGLLLVLFVMKLVATSLTLGSGGSGGIFSPSLFLGATLGGAYGMLIHFLFPHLPINEPAFAVVGMAGVVGGVTGAAITAIVMIFEMTLDYWVIVPMTITVALSYGIRKALVSESIYTMKLARRGHYMPEALQTNFHYLRLARDLKDTRLVSVPASETFGEFVHRLPREAAAACPCFLVEDDGVLTGVITPDRAYRALEKERTGYAVGELASPSFNLVTENTTLFEIIARLRTAKIDVFLVAHNPARQSADEVKGWISKERIAESMVDAIGLFAD